VNNGLADRPASTVAHAEELVRRIRAGEPYAFDELYARYASRVFGYLYQRLNGNAEDAEDLTAEVFTRVYEKIDSFQVQGAPLSAWLFRIAHNRLVDAVRRHRHPQVGLDDAPQLVGGRVFEGIDAAVAMEEIKRGLAMLTAEQRQVIQMRFLEGRSVAETAEAMQRGEEAVKKLQARGLASLRRGIECLSGCWRVQLEAAA
jgi:RNA polymerase sigma-70 factor, ECF subfamily